MKFKVLFNNGYSTMDNVDNGSNVNNVGKYVGTVLDFAMNSKRI
jgi:hypothetical protein